MSVARSKLGDWDSYKYYSIILELLSSDKIHTLTCTLDKPMIDVYLK